MESVISAVTHKDPTELLEVFVRDVLPTVMSEWVVGPIETYILGKLAYPYTHMMLWESQRPPVAVHHPLLDNLEEAMGVAGVAAFGMPARGMVRVRLADHPALVQAVRIELAVLTKPVDHPEKTPLRVTAVVKVSPK
ncbi:hypothetical protein pEaSNUABM11_00199 [Erwinia phage pEa_SNUABM_11]|nr:hypothetical protein pEaSNUABM11_00199 [Erwinia phage pEa_SNUABM_11]